MGRCSATQEKTGGRMRAVRAVCYERRVDAERRSPRRVAHHRRWAGWADSCRKAGNDRDADGDRNVRRDMHRVAMTRKPLQCLVSRRTCPWRWQCSTPNDSAPRNRGDVGGSIRRAIHASRRGWPLERGRVTWGVHGSRGVPTGKRWRALAEVFSRRQLTSSSPSFGSNFSCPAKARNESIGRRSIRMQRA